MSLVERTFLGIDTSGGREPFCLAALDQECNLVMLDEGDLDRILAILGEQDIVIAAINGPQRPNTGLVRRILEERGHSPGSLRGVDMRMVEYDLRERGISISSTPSRKEMCPSWIQFGFALYAGLAALPDKYTPYPTVNGKRQFMETHPHAVFCSLLGMPPLPKPTLEGRLQRQLVLHENGLKIIDPMEFFEEITRYRLLQGKLPMEFLYTTEQLDALAAAFVAFTAGTLPEKTLMLGDETEGQIVLPVNELKEEY